MSAVNEKVNMWVKMCCTLVGWNSIILSQCTEESFKHLKKYTSAMIILMMVWSTTGYCFASKYLQLSTLGCIIVAAIFVALVVQIERQIILSKKGKATLSIRLLIAVMMATLSSSIVDQYIFSDDIHKQLVDEIESQVKEQLPKRLAQINEEQSNLTVSIQSLDSVVSNLQKEVDANPIITVRNVNKTTDKRQDADGNWVSVPSVSVETSQIENPKFSTLKDNQSRLAKLNKRLQECSDKKQNIEVELRKEMWENSGFLEELEAVVDIILTRPIAGGFYLVLFLFLISLELFVVISKIFDTECDYDTTVEMQRILRQQKIHHLTQRNNDATIKK